MGHVILLGDSIFDNGAYVGGGPDVVRQLRGKLPADWDATLLAVDGDVSRDVVDQLRRLPRDATHLAISAGGNDALAASHLLHQSVGNVAEAVSLLEVAQQRFVRDYEESVEQAVATGLAVALCTVYDTPPSGLDYRLFRTALTLFNDIISRAAFARGLTLIDLRLLCGEDEDYANPIEPSVRGGDKIAGAIARFAAAPRSDGRDSRVIAFAG
jgi:hypothetical protein